MPHPDKFKSDWGAIGSHFFPESWFLGSLGHSDFAAYTQTGDNVEVPVFPFKVIYEPADDVKGLFADEYAQPVHELLQEVEVGSYLYNVYALENPSADRQLIAKIRLESKLVTSLWGDEHFYFRHTRMDDDLRVHPEWLESVESAIPYLQPYIQPAKPRVESNCPFAFLFK